MTAAGVPLWRVAVGVLVLAGLAGIGAAMAPVYIHNWRFQESVATLAEDPDTFDRSDDAIRTSVAERAHSFGLPVTQDEVTVARDRRRLKIHLRYAVRVTLPMYTVDLHFER